MSRYWTAIWGTNCEDATEVAGSSFDGVTRGCKDGLQPESLADGKLAGETKSTSVEN